uniref:PUM-HD domain-containing protein n=1 Tax=Wuchereria bancrofti TaxID=6293 RepID=A0A1I8ECK2_WUCBA
MTRKRKSVSVVENCYWGCGPNAPIKAVDSNWSSEFMENFNQRYGHIDYVEKWKKENLDQRFSTAETDYREEHELAVDTKNFEHNMEYPSELVEYMKQVACIIRDDPSLSVLKFTASSPKVRMKIYPVIIDHWVDLVVENWIQLISDRSAVHFIRTLTYHLVGLKRKRSQKTSLTKDVLSKKVQISQETFGRIANVALDYASVNAMLEKESVSLVLQDVVECESVSQTSYLRRFIEAACRHPDSVLKQWKGKQASHLWDIIVQKADEDLRQSLYHSVLEGRLFDLSLHTFANFTVQKYILSVKSNGLIINVFDELMDHFIDICGESKWRIIIALVQMARNRNELIIVKKLRNYFRCCSKPARLAFVPCVFTLTCRTSAQCKISVKHCLLDFNRSVVVAGISDIAKGQLHGSIILQELVNYEHNKTVVTSMKSLADATILGMARDKKGSFFLQTLFKSSTVSRTDKELIAKPLKLKWHEVITNNVSSHVFDVLWTNDVYNITEKEELMDALSKAVIEDHCKTLRLMCMKLNFRKFRENRKKWLKDAGIRFVT